MSHNGNEQTEIPDPEVVLVAERRRFTAEEKLRILDEADACTERSEIGALLRREGIYSSYLSKWRSAREQGHLTSPGARRRGPRPTTDAALVRENARLRRENQQLQKRLDQAETIIEVQKKLSRLIGTSRETSESNGK